jgi:hypothetical protein
MRDTDAVPFVALYIKDDITLVYKKLEAFLPKVRFTKNEDEFVSRTLSKGTRCLVDIAENRMLHITLINPVLTAGI